MVLASQEAKDTRDSMQLLYHNHNSNINFELQSNLICKYRYSMNSKIGPTRNGLIKSNSRIIA